MTNSVPFQRIAVIGTGLIGGSFALAIRKYLPKISVVGYDRPEPAAHALARGALHEVAADIPSAIRGADLIYIALPIGATLEILPALSSAAGPKSLVTDACSTKAVICRLAAKHFSGSVRFLGGHPMAGKEKSGIQNSDPDLFRGAPYVLVGTENEGSESFRGWLSVLAEIGAQPVWCDAETHDWAVAIVSHLPQLVSIALGRVVMDETDDTGLPLSLSGQGLQDSLRLAGSPYSVWRDILLTNKENISRGLDRVAQALDHLRTHLASKELEQEFKSANELYKLLRKPPVEPQP
jgi:prephenate dehydrogenase